MYREDIYALDFSAGNLKHMRRFAEAYPDEPIVQGLLAQITWYHNITILDKLMDPVARDFCIRAAIPHGWSRNVLVHQIESGLYQMQGLALVNLREYGDISSWRGEYE